MGGRIQVHGDLKPGQLVVVEGNERLRPGELVNASIRPDKVPAEQIGRKNTTIEPANAKANNAAGKPSG